MASVTVVTPPAVASATVVVPVPVVSTRIPARASCTMSLALASYYLVMACVLIIIPWGLSSLFSVAGAITCTIIGALILFAAVTHLYWISLLVARGKPCSCP